jgi:hypothetical protein
LQSWSLILNQLVSTVALQLDTANCVTVIVIIVILIRYCARHRYSNAS